MSTSGAQRRVIRTIGSLFAVGSAVFGLLTAPTIAAQSPSLPPVWTWAALAAQLGLPLLLGVAAVTGLVRTALALSTAVAVAGLLVLVSTAIVFPADASRAASPWPLQLTAIGTTAVALSLRPVLVGVDVVLTGVLVVVDRTLTAGSGLGLIPIQDGAYAMLFGAVFAALAVGARAAARSVDAAAAAALDVAAQTRDEHVRADERARVAGLVHDRVLTTLLVAARSPDPSPAAAADAAAALAELDRIATGADTTGPVTAAALLDRLRALLTVTAPAARVSVEGAATAAFPPTVAEVLLGAFGEAVRNSRKHAGPAATMEVHVALLRGAIEIAIVDDGVGFTASEVASDRLGIAGSIVARLERVGGSALVRSQPGRGTAVRLCWEPEP